MEELPQFTVRSPGDYNTQDLLEGELVGIRDTQYGEMRYYVHSKGKLIQIDTSHMSQVQDSYFDADQKKMIYPGGS